MANNIVIRVVDIQERNTLNSFLRHASTLTRHSLPIPSTFLQVLFEQLQADSNRTEIDVVALGIAFGEDIIRQGDFIWAHIEDMFGKSLRVAVRNKWAYCSPVDAVKKRVALTDPIDLSMLSHTLATHLLAMAAQPNTGDWSG